MARTSTTRFIPALLVGLALASMVIVGAWLIGAQVASRAVAENATRQLAIITPDLESILERYETLPFALSFQPQAALALRTPADTTSIASVNQTLAAIATQAKVAAIYLMDDRGNTIASSNWQTTQSYIGKNFGFRPYFLQAMQGHAGRFYGIGSTTAEPGYFIAQPVFAHPRAADGANAAQKPIGVIAVKIRLDSFAQAWNRIDDALVLVDQYGVVFLGNRPAWQYRSLTPLNLAMQNDLTLTMQYMGRAIAPLPPAEDVRKAVVQTVGRLGWRLMMVPNQSAVLRSAWLWTATATLLMAISAISALAWYQRRRRLQERGIARAALQSAADDLERTIRERTAELTAANASVEARYAKLKETEFLLRTTQNELVQAGKLTMLGQMAAGVTHELSQPLTAIRAFADNARTFLARDQAAPAIENLAQISAASERMGAIIGQLKGFARKSEFDGQSPSPSQVMAVDLAQAIRSSVRLLEADLQQLQCGIVITIEEVLYATGDVVRIEQVLINLLRNAIQANQQRHKPGEKNAVHVSLEREQNVALIRIRDDGPGLSQEVAARLFEPFFSTKTAGEGLGLGLAISSSIVQAMNGTLGGCNHPQGGAEFSLRLSVIDIAKELT